MKMNNRVCCLLTLMLFNFPVYADNKVVVVPLFDSPSVAPQKIMFATTGTWSGNLGGLAGADAKCNAEAVVRGIAGSFQALLGSADDFPLRRSTHADSAYFSVVGAPLKSDFHSLFDAGGLDSPIYPNGAAWSGLNENGSPSAANCLNWTSSDSNQSGMMGYTDDTGNAGWLASEGLQCDELLQIYCIEQ